MLASHRRADLSPDSFLESHAVTQRSLRIEIERTANLVVDDRFTRVLPSPWRTSFLVIVLEGRLFWDEGGRGRWLEPGDLACAADRRTVGMRREGASYRAITIEWQGGACAEVLRQRRVPAHDSLVALRSLAARFVGEVEGAHVERETLAALAGWLPLRVVATGEQSELPSPQMVMLSRELDRVFSNLSCSPMMVDLEQALGLCSRQLHRLMALLHARFGIDAPGFREALHRRRVTVGASLLTAPDATCARVAQVLGYRSPSAMSRAFSEAGLPAPSSIPLLARTPREQRVDVMPAA